MKKQLPNKAKDQSSYLLSSTKVLWFGIWAVLLVVAILLLAIVINPNKSYESITVSGLLLDGDSGDVLGSDYTARYGEQEVVVGDDGSFELANVNSQDRFQVSGPCLFQPLIVSVSGREQIEVHVNCSISVTLDPFFWELELRQYRQSYEQILPALREKVSEEDFLAEMNNWRENKDKAGKDLESIDYAVVTNESVFYSEILDQEFDNVLELDVGWHFGGENVVDYNTPVYFVKQNEQWWWLWSPNFLP